MDVTRYRIPTRAGDGGALGRHLEHDPRSRNYRAPVTGVPLRTHRWHRNRPVFDQGNLGSCTGNAVVGMAATDPVTLPRRHYTEAQARKCYELATQLDGFDGTYPPDDTGSSGLAACKAAVALGLATRYLWGFGGDDMARMVSAIGPCAVGIDWKTGLDSPDAGGIAYWTGPVRGGHEFEVVGLHLDTSLGAPGSELYECVNSWGTTWGREGRFYVPVEDMHAALAAGGDVVTLATDHLA